MKTASELLRKAVELVTGTREQQHGDKYDNHQKIANIWNAYLSNVNPEANISKWLAPSDVANMMELLKVARRQCGGHNPDDYLDGAGYASVAFECAEIENMGPPEPSDNERLKNIIEGAN